MWLTWNTGLRFHNEVSVVTNPNFLDVNGYYRHRKVTEEHHVHFTGRYVPLKKDGWHTSISLLIQCVCLMVQETCLLCRGNKLNLIGFLHLYKLKGTNITTFFHKCVFKDQKQLSILSLGALLINIRSILTLMSISVRLEVRSGQRCTTKSTFELHFKHVNVKVQTGNMFAFEGAVKTFPKRHKSLVCSTCLIEQSDTKCVLVLFFLLFK